MSTATIERPKKAGAAKRKMAVQAASTLDSMRGTLEQVRASLGLVIQSAETDSGCAEALLFNAKESHLARAIDALRAPSFGRAELGAVYDGLFLPLAMIEGATALLSGSVFESAIRDAHALLTWAHSEMAIGGALDQSLPAIDTKVSSFNNGRDLAIEMLKAAEALENTGWTEPRRWVRDGKAQNRFALPFLQRLIAEPELAGGFAAVLSGRLGTTDAVRADDLALSQAEYEAGPLGGDGTEDEPADTPQGPQSRGDEPAQKPRATPASTQPAGGVPAADFDADGASRRLAHARSVSVMLCMIFGNGTGVSPDEIRDLDGLMGAVQHLRNILATLHAEVREVKGELPNDFRTGVFEASSLATLIDEVEWAGQYKFMLGNFTMSEYFSTICDACDLALDAITTLEGAAA